MLGLYVSDHPLAGLKLQLAKHAGNSITEVLGGDVAGDGEHVTIAGLITSVQHRTAYLAATRQRLITVEDFCGGEITDKFFGKAYQGAHERTSLFSWPQTSVDDGMNSRCADSANTPDLASEPRLRTTSTISMPEFQRRML
jgi:DNA polymerase III alpha subunit